MPQETSPSRTSHIQRQTHIIDATDISFGRLASKIAVLLQGKHKTSFLRHVDGGDIVHVKNIRKMKITGNKISQKEYFRHTGYPGGLKTESVKDLLVKNPGKILEYAVMKMLPKNLHRPRRMKRMKILAE